MNELVEKQELYKAVENTIEGLFFDVHAIYEPEPNSRGWYCAAVDLFHPGMTFRVYFTVGENQQIHVEHVERWLFG